MCDAVFNRLATIRDLKEGSTGLLDASANVRKNILDLLKSRVVCGEDRQICHASADLAHRVTALLRAVSATAEDHDETLRMILAQSLKKALHADCIVRVIDDHAALL